jgi:hypothetical protein
MARQHISQVTVNGFRKCCISNAVERTDGGMLWNGNEEDGNVRKECKVKALTVKMETVTLIGKRIQNLTRFVY